MPDLVVSPCRNRCDWLVSGSVAGLRRFTCAGCGSQWDRTQRWTPAQADGSVAADVEHEAGETSHA